MVSRRHRRHRPVRRGFALMDVIIGGIMLGAALSVIISLSSRALARQTDGEKRMIAAWLADELLNMVLIEGPHEYPRRNDTSGWFRPPFEEFSFDLDIRDRGLAEPFGVAATVRWPTGEVRVESLMAVRRDEDPELKRGPLEPPFDREGRSFDEEYDDEAG